MNLIKELAAKVLDGFLKGIGASVAAYIFIGVLKPTIKRTTETAAERTETTVTILMGYEWYHWAIAIGFMATCAAIGLWIGRNDNTGE